MHEQSAAAEWLDNMRATVGLFVCKQGTPENSWNAINTVEMACRRNGGREVRSVQP